MNETEHLAETQRWLRYPREDLEGAETLRERRVVVPRHICWLAQQSVEKALKAILVFLAIDFPRRHDLDALRNLALITGSATFGLTAWKTCSPSPRARHRLSQALCLLTAVSDHRFFHIPVDLLLRPKGGAHKLIEPYHLQHEAHQAHATRADFDTHHM
jgi:hypothetical protein